MKLGCLRRFLGIIFLSLLVAAPSSLAQESSETPDESSFKWTSLFTWPFNHIVQPVLNGLIYPIATPIDYAFKNGVVEKSIGLITFGEKENIQVYPSFNLKPGSNTSIGLCYRHRDALLDKDYLVLQTNYFANSDFDVTLRYSKQALFGTPLFGGFRFDMDWNRDDHFIIPETKSGYLQPDSSYSFNWRLGFPLSKSRNWNFEIWTTQDFYRYDVPDVEDSLLISKDYSIEDRGLYQNHMEYPIGLSLVYDDLDVPFAPSKGSRIYLSGSYNIVGKYNGVHYADLGLDPKDFEGGKVEDSGINHDYIKTEILFQHYFFLGKGESYILSASEARQNRKFYTDFSWDEVIRVWRPENMMQTLFERRVLAFQYRLIDIWEMEKGGAPHNAFPLLNARTPLRGYGDAWTAHHLMSFSLEYRWPVDRFVDGVFFNEYALIAPEIDDWSREYSYNSWGFGIRVRHPNMYLFRVQLGFHGIHGVNLVLTIAPEFK